MTTILQYEPGLHRDVPEGIYHAKIRGLVSKGALDRVNRSPQHYLSWLNGQEEPDIEAFRVGKALHCALLEPDRFATEYAVEPDFGDCRKKENKAARDEWRQLHAVATLIDADTDSSVRGMVKAVRSHPLASRMIADGDPEVTVRWRDDETGLQCKTRMDYYVRNRAMVVDVKSTEDASAEAFRRSITKYRYHVQDALYRFGLGAIGAPIEHFVFVVVEKRPPHAVATYTLDSDGIQRGYAHARAGIDMLAECLRNDAWPGYPVTIQTLELPPWAA